MKTIVFAMLTLSILIGQDLIVTTDGDSIHCNITKTDENYIFCSLKYNNDVQKTLIPKSSVDTYEIGFFLKPEVPNEALKKQKKNYRVQLTGGIGKRTAKIPDDYHSDIQEYIEELKTGFSLNGSVHLLTSKSLGFGLSASRFQAENEIQSISVNDDITITFIGASVLSFMNLKHEKTKLVSIASVGYLYYYNTSQAGELKLDFEGTTIGLQYSLGVDMAITDNHGMSLSISYLIGSLSKITVSDGQYSETIDLKDDERESLNRLDFTIGICF